MPISPTYPGVYIEEIPSGVRTIVGVATSVAAFIDFFARGPMNHAVQIFNIGDFEREFGGLHTKSEASYGIQQFFLNGGSNAWVVRTAEKNTYKTASIIMQDGKGTDVLQAKAGRLLKGKSVEDPGNWGNNLRIDIDYNTTDPSDSFNLTISELEFQGDRQQVAQTETYRNLTMDSDDSDYAVGVVNEGSKLIQLTRLTPVANKTTRPAQTGTWGTNPSKAISAGGLNTTDTFTISYNGNKTTGKIQFKSQPTTLTEVRGILQAAIRDAGAQLTPAEPLLTGATVQLIGNKTTGFGFRVTAGRTSTSFNPQTILTFKDDSGSPATNMGIDSATASANVQQYVLGDNTSIGAQKAGKEGDNGNPPYADALRGIRDPDKTGLYALEDVDLFNILCIPRTAELTDLNEMQAVVSEALAYCEERRAFMIVDLPPTKNTMQKARDWLEDNATLRHRNAAAYFPRVKIPDSLNNYRLRSFGASGTIAGLYAHTDANRGVWKAPAGIEGVLRNVSDLDYKLVDQENGQLNPLGLNCLRNFDIYGNVCWGSRTLVGADQQASEWKYIPVRRLALFIEESLFRETQWVVFEPNDEPLWAQIRLNVGAFMHNLFRQGAFQGTTPRDAYFVKCDKETTIQNDIDRGIVNILVGFAPLKPAEFVIIKISQIAGQIQT